MLKIPGRRTSRIRPTNEVSRAKVVTAEVSQETVALLRQVKDGKIRVSRGGGMDITVSSTVKGTDFDELRFMLAAAGRSELVDITGDDTPWWDFGDYTVTLTGLGETVLTAREALARSAQGAAKKIINETFAA